MRIKEDFFLSYEPDLSACLEASVIMLYYCRNPGTKVVYFEVFNDILKENDNFHIHQIDQFKAKIESFLITIIIDEQY